MGTQRFEASGGGLGPPPETAGRQSFLAHPESLAIIAEDFYGGLALVSKNEQVPREWIRFQFSPAQPR